MSPRWCRRTALLAVLVLLSGMACGPGGSPAQPAAPAAKPASAVSAPAPAGAPPAAPARSPALDALVQGARGEGQLTLVYGNFMGGAEAVQRWTPGFNRQHGLDLSVSYTPGPPMAQIAHRVMEEQQAGRPAVTDILVMSGIDVVKLLEGDAVQTLDWSWAPNIQQAPSVVHGGGVAVAGTTHTVGTSYNTQRVRGDDVPRTMEDLLKPQYKGRIATTPYTTLFTFASSEELWGEQRTRSYVERFAEQVTGLIRCSELARVSAGEFDIFTPDCAASYYLIEQARGAPVDHAIPADMALIQYYYYLIPKNAPHPNAAKLWIDYVMGREAQDVMYEIEFSDQYRVPGSKSLGRIQQAQATGTKFADITLEFLQRSDVNKLTRTLADLDRIVQKK
jgi:ABC-type Fe3+ transport system substrate-binding protein